MKSGLIEPHYLPCLEYFCAILHLEELVLEKHEHYVKQSYRNRCYINAVNGPTMLAVPLTAKHGKVPFKDVRIDIKARWQNNHWRSIVSAYAKSPFFEHYGPDLEKIIFGKFDFVYDLNRELLSFCLVSLGMVKKISETDHYGDPGEAVIDLRSAISGKKPYSSRALYMPKPYYQVFGNAFASNLSVIDLLFCEGPNAPGILRASAMGVLNK